MNVYTIMNMALCIYTMLKNEEITPSRNIIISGSKNTMYGSFKEYLPA